jgi:hypothetical protein
MQAFWQRHLERCPDRAAAGHAVAFDQRCQGRGRGWANLRMPNGNRADHKRDTTKDPEDT